MEPITLQELWQMLGEKDVVIFQMLKQINKMTVEIDNLKKELVELKHNN
jgi:hypothetical protein